MRIITLILRLFAVMAFAVMASPHLRAQANLQGMTASDILPVVNEYINNGELIKARPLLNELVSRYEGNEQFEKQLEEAYFYLGFGYVQEYQTSQDKALLRSAIPWFEKLIQNYPRSSRLVTVSLALGNAYRALNDLPAAIEVLTRMLRPPMSGMMSATQRIETIRSLAMSHYLMQSGEDALPVYELYFNEARESHDKTSAASFLMETYLVTGRFNEFLGLMPYLSPNSPARYDIRFNGALLKAGDRLFNEGKNKEAMLVYRLILSREELIRWQTNHLERLKREKARREALASAANADIIAELAFQIALTESQLKALEDVTPYSEALKARIARNFIQSGRAWEAFWTYELMKETYADSPLIEDYYYFAFSTALMIGELATATEIGEDYLNAKGWHNYASDITISLTQNYLRLERFDDLFALGTRYVNDNPQARETMQVVHMMATGYAQTRRILELVNQFTAWRNQYPDAPMRDALSYWIGLSHLFAGNYAQGLPNFNEVLEDFPDSPYVQDALYRRGVCYFGTDDLDKAKQDFTRYIERYPNTALQGEVEYFLGEIEAANGNVKAAIRHYRNVEKYTDNMSYILNAYYQTGTLLEANGLYTAMVNNYEILIDKYPDMGDISKAIYELGRGWGLKNRPDQQFGVYLDSILEYGNDPMQYGMDSILASYISSYNEKLDEINTTIDFLTRLVKEADFRSKLLSDRKFLVSFFEQNPKIEASLVQQFYKRDYRVELSKSIDPIRKQLEYYFEIKEKFPKESPVALFTRIYEKAKQQELTTLALRVQRVLDMHNKNPDPAVLFSDDDFPKSSPAVLIWIGDKMASFEQQLAVDAYTTVIETHPESNSVRDAYLNRGEVYFEAGDYQLALNDFVQAEELFPADPETWKATLKQGHTYRKLNDFERARELYQRAINNRDWRGVIHAEALYHLGMSHFEQNQFSEAHTYFQRLYIGYIGFADWAARGYYHAGQSLIRMNRSSDAIKTYQAAVRRPELQQSPYLQQIKEAL